MEETANMDSTPNQARTPPSEPSPSPVELGIHVLVGKLRRPQPTQRGARGNNAAQPEYVALWAHVRFNGAPLSHRKFQAAVSDAVNALLAQQENRDAVTLFRPIGKYISYHMIPQGTTTTTPTTIQPGHFNPPPTSLLAHLPTSQDPRRPLKVDFYTHSRPQPHRDAQEKFESELRSHLRTLDRRLAAGPGGKNTLGLGEVAGGSRGGGPGWALAFPRRDWACAAELSLLLLELNNRTGKGKGKGNKGRAGGGGGGGSELLQAAVTRSGAVDSPELLGRNHGEMLSYLGRKMYVVWPRVCGDVAEKPKEDKAETDKAEADKAEADTTAGEEAEEAEEDDTSRFKAQPGFELLLRDLASDVRVQMEEDHRRAMLLEQYATYGWISDL